MKIASPTFRSAATPPEMPMLSTRVRQETRRRVADAAKRADQPIAAWIRMAIMEKLARDAGD